MNITKKFLYPAVLLLGACLVSIGLAFGNYYYYQFVNSYLNVKDVFLSALLFSAFFLIIGGVIVAWKPRFYGFQIGDSLKKWRTVLVTIIVVCVFTALCLLLTPRTPYSGANWAVEMILVPVAEETIWRGVIFSLLLLLLGRVYTERVSTVLAVIFSSISFGLAHSSNILVHPASFVLLQVIFASVVGIGMGFIRAKTKSIYPAFILHAAFNLIAILF